MALSKSDQKHSIFKGIIMSNLPCGCDESHWEEYGMNDAGLTTCRQCISLIGFEDEENLYQLNGEDIYFCSNYCHELYIKGIK